MSVVFTSETVEFVNGDEGGDFKRWRESAQANITHLASSEGECPPTATTTTLSSNFQSYPENRMATGKRIRPNQTTTSF